MNGLLEEEEDDEFHGDYCKICKVRYTTWSIIQFSMMGPARHTIDSLRFMAAIY